MHVLSVHKVNKLQICFHWNGKVWCPVILISLKLKVQYETKWHQHKENAVFHLCYYITNYLSDKINQLQVMVTKLKLKLDIINYQSTVKSFYNLVQYKDSRLCLWKKREYKGTIHCDTACSTMILQIRSEFSVKYHVILTHWCRDKMGAILQTTPSIPFSWLKMFEFRLHFHWSLFLRVQLTIFQHWFR